MSNGREVSYASGVTVQFPPAPEPSALEKTLQMDRILATKLFKKSAQLSKVLRFLIESDLAGIALDVYTVGIKVLDRREDWYPTDDNTVREAMRRLRNMLDTYYSFEGVEDRLNLEFDQYKPAFSYNLRHPVERNFRRALRYVATDCKVAFSLLSDTLELEPTHAEAYAAWAETDMWRLFYGWEISLDGVELAVMEQLQRAFRYDKHCWRAFVVLGAMHCCRRQWQSADRAFAAALESSPGATKAHPWYAAFLMAAGREEEALELTRARAGEPSDTPWPLLTYAAFLYAARRFDEAKAAIREARKDYDDTWLGHVLWSCVLSGLGRDKSTVPLLGMSLQQSLPDGTVVYTGLTILEQLRRLSPDHADYPSVRRLFEAWVKKKLEAWNMPEEKYDLSPFQEQRVSPFHLAIGYMAIDNNRSAVEFLAIDVKQGHPFMVWLHLWPLFDPLRELPEFKRLIEQLDLPDR